MPTLRTLAVAIALLQTAAAEAQTMSLLQFNAFYQENRDKVTPEGTIDEVYNRTFKANTVGSTARSARSSG